MKTTCINQINVTGDGYSLDNFLNGLISSRTFPSFDFKKTEAGIEANLETDNKPPIELLMNFCQSYKVAISILYVNDEEDFGGSLVINNSGEIVKDEKYDLMEFNYKHDNDLFWTIINDLVYDPENEDEINYFISCEYVSSEDQEKIKLLYNSEK